jgi:hypothetical protein
MSKRNGWRWAKARAEATGVVFSVVVWLGAFVFAPWVGGVLLVAVVIAVVWRSSPLVLRWWWGVRPASAIEAASVLESLIVAPVLRGRGQPTIWVRVKGGGQSVDALTSEDVILSQQQLLAVMRRQVADDELTALVLHAVGRARLTRRRLDAVLVVVNLPWELLCAVTVAVGSGRLGRIPVIGALWVARPVVFTIAIIQQAQAGRWPVAITVAVLLAVTWLHPHWVRAWRRRVEQAGDDYVADHHLGPTYARILRRGHPDLETEARAARLEEPV